MAKYLVMPDGTEQRTTSSKNYAILIHRDGKWEVFSYHNRVELVQRQAQQHGNFVGRGVDAWTYVPVQTR